MFIRVVILPAFAEVYCKLTDIRGLIERLIEKSVSSLGDDGLIEMHPLSQRVNQHKCAILVYILYEFGDLCQSYSP